MSTHLVCPICGKQFECKGPHEGPHDVLTTVGKCQVDKGAIYVNVKDTAGNPIPGVKTFCGKNDDSTSSAGFTSFEKLDAGPYPTRIDLDASGTTVTGKYYATLRTGVTAQVEAGKITMVDFILNRYANLSVRLERQDGEKDLPRAKFSAQSKAHTPDPPEATDQQAQYKKMKPTETYTVRCDLNQEDAKNYQIDRVEDANVTVSPDKLSEVVFQVKPRYWIEIAVQDAKDSGMKGKFSLKHSGGRSYNADDVGAEAKHVPDLEQGTMTVESVTLTASREFAGLA
jgi:hypothetical protein